MANAFAIRKTLERQGFHARDDAARAGAHGFGRRMACPQ
jgi:hypothetical protein